MLHYFARRFFAPLLISPFLSADELDVYLVSDMMEDMKGLQLEATLVSLSSGEVLKQDVILVDAVRFFLFLFFFFFLSSVLFHKNLTFYWFFC